MVGRQYNLRMDQTTATEAGIIGDSDKRHCPWEFPKTRLVLQMTESVKRGLVIVAIGF